MASGGASGSFSPSNTGGARIAITPKWREFGRPRSLAAADPDAAFFSRRSPWVSIASVGSPAGDAFIQRQFSPPSLAQRRGFSLLQAELVRHGGAHSEKSRGAAGFRDWLRHRFGSSLAGWRALDKHWRERLTESEFFLACRAAGYHGKVRTLWAELDALGTGTVCFADIDPEVERSVELFRTALLDKYGDIQKAWRAAVDINANGRVLLGDLEAALHRLGLQLDCRALFEMLGGHPHIAGSGITLAQTRLDHLGPPGTPLGPPVLLPREDAGADAEGAQDPRIKGVGLRSTADLKRALLQRFPSLLSAWRQALDLDGNGSLAFGEFTLALNRLGMHGDLKGIWEELDVNGKGSIIFADFDKKTDAMMEEVRARLADRYGTLFRAWFEGIDTTGNNNVTEGEFVAACLESGSTGDAKMLFKQMVPVWGGKFITLEDFDRAAFLAFSRGDFRMLNDEYGDGNGGGGKLAMTFLERQASYPALELLKAHEEARNGPFAKACHIAPAETEVKSTEEFERNCKRRFGSIAGAWRHCLDPGGQGTLPHGTFLSALRRMGYNGDYHALWHHYVRGGRGRIGLADLDARAAERIGHFMTMLASTYGTLAASWRRGLGKGELERASEEELQQLCDHLGYPYSAQELFKDLLAPGKHTLAIWDLDPAAAKNLARGDVSTISISAPKSAGGHSTAPPRERPPPGTSKTYHGVTLLEALRIAFRKQHGSTVSAWRKILDPKLEGSVAYSPFCLALGHGAFNGSVQALWKELTSHGAPQVAFRDIDEASQRFLDAARARILQRCGSLRVAWELLAGGADLVNKERFLRACRRHALDGGSERWSVRLWGMLLSRHGQLLLAQEDFEAVLIGIPPEERPAWWNGGAKAPALSEDVDSYDRAPLEMVDQGEGECNDHFSLRCVRKASEVAELRSTSNEEKESELAVMRSVSREERESGLAELSKELRSCSQEERESELAELSKALRSTDFRSMDDPSGDQCAAD